MLLSWIQTCIFCMILKTQSKAHTYSTNDIFLSIVFSNTQLAWLAHFWHETGFVTAFSILPKKSVIVGQDSHLTAQWNQATRNSQLISQGLQKSCILSHPSCKPAKHTT